MKDDDFSRTHPAFLWAFRASRNWALVKGIIPSMKNTLQSNESEINRLINQRGIVTENDQDTAFSFDTIFKHFFCISAQNLADDLRLPLSGLGELYHQVLSTVTQVSRFELGSRALPRIGKGQLMFTVRQLDEQEAVRFMASGYRFAPIERVTDILSRRIHLSSTDLALHLHEMRDYASSDRGYPPGVHLVAFGLRPTLREHFEILTRAGGGLALPSSTLPISSLTKADLELLNSMDECGFTTCLKQLLALRSNMGASHGSVSSVDTLSSTASEESFPTHLYRAMLELMTCLPENIASAARFSAKPLLAPCRRQSPSDPEQCILICFRVVSALDTRISDANLTFTPLRLFRVQEQVNDKISERERFIRELNAEFASYSAQSTAIHKEETALSKPSEKIIVFPSKIWSRIQSGMSNKTTQLPGRLQRATSQESLVQQQSELHAKSSFLTAPKSPHAPSGGSPTRNVVNPFINEILVSKEVTVDVARLDDVEMTDISTKRASTLQQPNISALENNDAISEYQVDGHVSYSMASLAGAERRTVIEGGLARFGTTYVDELYGLCLGREVRMKPGFYIYDNSGGS
jgi:hypothetical protein